MSELVRTQRQERVLVVTVDNPPVNALSPGVAEGIVEAVRAAQTDAEIDAIIVTGAGRTFVAGADIKELGRIVAGERPMIDLNPLFNEIEDSAKTVIMALHGTALGGGLELALAGHYRIAYADTRLGQPEVKLGLIPGAGGTQRLPRLVGLEAALDLCVHEPPQRFFVKRSVSGHRRDQRRVYSLEPHAPLSPCRMSWMKSLTSKRPFLPESHSAARTVPSAKPPRLRAR